ncbi:MULTISPECIES: hypothetical protein [unclassified Bradyrhizobium]|uniref:hypothetical protein n=1 Tax=unclassified Bradyrhizobium TaxID=2631580 RepID=UPI001CD34696|nr:MULTISPECIES: hypothetical protein [unclassified Bradyrhizobium]MCA1386079.1 hypothetical protein [Bradyrhizobium sp. BRP05]MCA1393877.1 hypothetical protein [Bradyrhizobium sp. IC3123]MCA1423521.1 hypothetical protein [Bradyrhizobium sp. BRP23]MCA1431079.1 hypothetical protein [Bradyrhizobium sp. NBAIM16]MCA1480096.1 hypothetical protein [Bradyrhizobium sp. NBAIM08]
MQQLDTKAKRSEFQQKADKRARHHAPQIEEIVPIVIEAVYEFADPGSGRLAGRSGWAAFGGRRVWGGYKNKKIEFREENRLGRAVARFDNGSSKSEVERQVRGFRRRK